MSKYVLLIYPKSGFEIEFVNIHMPMCFLSIAAPLLEKEYEVEILDQRIEKKFFEKLERC